MDFRKPTPKIVEISDLSECIRLTQIEEKRYDERLEKAEKNKLPGSKVVSCGGYTIYAYSGAIKQDEKTHKGEPVVDTQKLKNDLLQLGWKFKEYFAGYDEIGRICYISNGEEGMDLTVVGW